MSKELFIYGLYLGFLGFMLVLYLAYLIKKNNESLRQTYRELNKEIISAYENVFARFEEYMNGYFNEHKRELDMFSTVLRNETDKYSSVINEYRNTILSLSRTSQDIVQANKEVSNELSHVVFNDMKKINENLIAISNNYSDFERRLNVNLTSVNELLKGFAPMQQSFAAAENNFRNLDALNDNFSKLVTGVKESAVQMQLISNSLSALMETSLKPVVTEITAVLPEIRSESIKISDALFVKFDELVQDLKDVNKRLDSITETYRAILDGNKKDPVTKTFIS